MRRRPAIGTAFAALLLTIAGCGGEHATTSKSAESASTATPPPGAATTPPGAANPTATAAPRRDNAIERLEAGRGARGATIFRPRGVDRPPGVVFIHGWGGISPDIYGPWIRHLVRNGNQVIYPRYQLSPISLPSGVLDNTVAGVRAALARAPIEPGSLVFAGHSAGGALSADLAAIARASGLPRPRAVYAVYAGRKLPRIPLGIPEKSPRRIPASTRIVSVVSPGDEVVGTEAGRRIVRGASTHRRLIAVRDPAVADHLAPTRDTPAARRTFWAPLDRLIARARRADPPRPTSRQPR